MFDLKEFRYLCMRKTREKTKQPILKRNPREKERV